MKQRILGLKIFVIVTFIMMVTVNALANILPINGVGTGEVSDNYGNLFAPAAITFAIWGLIYLLLLGFTVYFALELHKIEKELKSLLIFIGIWFGLSSIANTIWIFAWHYDAIWLTLPLMIFILVSLIMINMKLRQHKLSFLKKILIRLPFTIYFGWITVATVANTTTFLVWSNWSRLNLSEVFWADIIFVIGAGIGFASILYYKSYAYGMVLIWAYVGILIKHLSADGFNGEYMSAVITICLSLLALVVAQVFLFRIKRRKEKLA